MNSSPVNAGSLAVKADAAAVNIAGATVNPDTTGVKTGSAPLKLFPGNRNQDAQRVPSGTKAIRCGTIMIAADPIGSRVGPLVVSASLAAVGLGEAEGDIGSGEGKGEAAACRINTVRGQFSYLRREWFSRSNRPSVAARDSVSLAVSAIQLTVSHELLAVSTDCLRSTAATSRATRNNLVCSLYLPSSTKVTLEQTPEPRLGGETEYGRERSKARGNGEARAALQRTVSR